LRTEHIIIGPVNLHEELTVSTASSSASSNSLFQLVSTDMGTGHANLTH